jgi:hypothetical protein
MMTTMAMKILMKRKKAMTTMKVVNSTIYMIKHEGVAHNHSYSFMFFTSR